MSILYVFVFLVFLFFFFKQKTAYEMRISDWSSDVCSSDLPMHLDADYARRARIIGIEMHGIGVARYTGKQGDVRIRDGLAECGFHTFGKIFDAVAVELGHEGS